MGSLAIILSSSLFLLILSVVIKILLKVWWTPVYTQRLMRSQGIKGPSFRFLHGNTKEMLNMRKESLSTPMGLSNHICPRIQPHLYKWSNIYGTNFLCWFGHTARLVVGDPELIKEVLNKDQDYPKPETRWHLKKLLGDGLVTTQGKKWAKHRKLANRTFRGENLKSMTSLMIASVEEMLEGWKRHEGEEVDVYEEFRILTAEVISRTAFGSSYLEGKDIFEMLRKLGIIISRTTFSVRFPGLSHFLKNKDDIESDELEKGIRDSILGIMQRREKVKNEGDDYGNEFLGVLVSAYHDSDASKRITLDDVVDECKTFYLAGHESTSGLLAWSVLLLAIHTDWQEKARQEVLACFGLQCPSSDGLTGLKTMSMIINESLRLYPPVPAILRRVKSDVRIGNLFLPQDLEVIVPILGIHHDTRIWGDDAQLFKPERFAEGVTKAIVSNHPGAAAAAAFIPFSFGPRICIGLNFATNEAKIALSMILQRYSFTLSPTYIHSPAPALTIHPQHGIQIMFHPL